MSSAAATLAFAGYRFPVEAINQAVWLRFPFSLGLHMVEEMLTVRGIVVSHDTRGVVTV